jgi:hypothetical protein
VTKRIVRAVAVVAITRQCRRMVKRVAILGNCQVWGLAASLKLQLPKAEVDSFFIGDIKTPEQGDAVARRLADYDIVVGQERDDPRYGGATASHLRDTVNCWVRAPKIGFTGFHPDIAALTRPGAQAWRCGLDHSIIVAGAFLAGIEAGRVERLFNSYIFARLGYFDEYPKARAYLVGVLNRTDLDGEAVITSWERQGVFMHMPNHPTAAALHELGRAICARHGLEAAETEEVPQDHLVGCRRWPVYAGLARRLGVQGGGPFHISEQKPPMTLAQFIGHAYRRYGVRADDIAAIPAIRRAAEILAAEVRPMRNAA